MYTLLYIVYIYNIECILVRVHLTVSSRIRACGVLKVKILNECILSVFVYNFFL